MLEIGKFYCGTRPDRTEKQFRVIRFGDPGWVFARETFFSDDIEGDLHGWINVSHFSLIREITREAAYPNKSN